MKPWFPMPRYGVTLAAKTSCGHVVWAWVEGEWPHDWIGSVYCQVCDRISEIRQWWHVR